MQSLNLQGFRRVNEKTHPELLEPDELTVLENMILTDDGDMGKPVVRGGFGIFNNRDTEPMIISMHDLQDEDQNHYVITCNDSPTTSPPKTEIFKSAGGNTNFVRLFNNLASGARIEPVNLGRGRYILTNGSNRPKLIQGQFFGTTSNASITKPIQLNVSDTFYLTGGGLGTKGSTSLRYSWVFTYADKFGNESNVSLPFTTDTVTGPVSGNQTDKIELGNLVYSTDTRVVSIRIYRTENFGETYYLEETIQNDTSGGTYNWTSTKADVDLDFGVTPTYINMPTVAYHGCLHKDRLFFGNVARPRENVVTEPPRSDDVSITNDGGVGAGSVGAGTYHYAYSYLYSDLVESELSTRYSHTVGTSGSTVTITSIPSPRHGAGKLNHNVSAIRIYRTELATTTPYYHLGDIDPDDTAYTDAISDATLIANSQYPKSGTGSTTSQTFLSGIAWSDIGATLMFPDENITQVDEDNDGSITGIFDDRDGVLIFKERGIYKLFTTGAPEQWRMFNVVSGIGCDQRYTVVKSDQTYFFIFRDTAYMYSSNQLSEIGAEFTETIGSVDVFGQSCFLSKYLWYVAPVTIDSAYYFLVYDIRAKSWYKFTGIVGDEKFPCTEKKYGASAGLLLYGIGGTYDGEIGWLNESATVDNFGGSNVTINPKIRTKTFTFKDGITLARARKLRMKFDRLTEVTIKIVNPEDSTQRQEADGLSGTGNKEIDFVTDGMDDSGTMTVFNKLYFEITGGIKKFFNLHFLFRLINRGKRL